jgi:peptidoglycan L-alanyl-D-glutamate endopeptidase CwlK
MSSKDINKLVPELQSLYYTFLLKCKGAGLDFVVTCTTRTLDEQKALVEQGKSKTMNSKHLTGKAFDIVAIKDGKPTWKFEDYKRYADVSPVDLVWGGSWKKFKDGCHFELREVE